MNVFERRLANSENLITSLNRNLTSEFNKMASLEGNIKNLEVFNTKQSFASRSEPQIDIMSMNDHIDDFWNVIFVFYEWSMGYDIYNNQKCRI